MTNYVLSIPAPFWLLLSAAFFAGGEYLSKVWANSPTLPTMLLVISVYALGTVAWLPALLHKNELAVMGTAWLLLATAATVVIGIFAFGETLNPAQWCGVGLALLALFLLSQ